MLKSIMAEFPHVIDLEYESSDKHSDRVKWLFKSCDKEFRYIIINDTVNYIFRDKNDAFSFKLRWG